MTVSMQYSCDRNPNYAFTSVGLSQVHRLITNLEPSDTGLDYIWTKLAGPESHCRVEVAGVKAR